MHPPGAGPFTGCENTPVVSNIDLSFKEQPRYAKDVLDEYRYFGLYGFPSQGVSPSVYQDSWSTIHQEPARPEQLKAYLLSLQNRDLMNFACQQDTSMELQDFLRRPAKDLSLVISRFAALMLPMAGDPVGNYVSQVLLEKLEADDFVNVARGIFEHAYELAVHVHATRVLQKAVKLTILKGGNLMVEMLEILKPILPHLAADPNGCYLVMLLLEERNEFAADCVVDIAEDLVHQRWGVVTLKKCVEFMGMKQKEKLELLFARKFKEIATDPFGNYALHHFLNHVEFLQNNLVQACLDHFEFLCTNKYACNCVDIVVKKCLGSTHLEQLLTKSFINLSDTSIRSITLDRYGFPVILRCLEIPEIFNTFKFSLSDIVSEALRTGDGRVRKLIDRHPQLRPTNN